MKIDYRVHSKRRKERHTTRRVLKNPKTETKSETKRLFSTSGQRAALPDSGSHHSFNTLLGGLRSGRGRALSFGIELPALFFLAASCVALGK